MSMSLSIQEIYVLENGNRKRTGDGEFEQVRGMESAPSGVVTFRYSTVEPWNGQNNRGR